MRSYALQAALSLSTLMAASAGTVRITFNVDMSEQRASDEGVFVASKPHFGMPGTNALTDPDKDGIYSGTFEIDTTNTDPDPIYYAFTNGACQDWGCKEGLAGQSCAFAEAWNERRIHTSTGQLTINACYGRCGHGTCKTVPKLDTVALTFNVDMSSVTPSTEGVYLAGGGTFGMPGDNRLYDTDGDGIYSITVQSLKNHESYYTITNGNCKDWECKEVLTGQACGFADHWGDRKVVVAKDDVVVNSCFEHCGDGKCADITKGRKATVTFNVDMSDVDISPEGVFIAGGGTFGQPGQNSMSDADGDGIWSVTKTLPADTYSHYTFTNGACHDFSCKEDIGHQPCALPPWNDRSFQLEGEDLTFNLCFGTCGLGKCSSLAHHVTTKVIFEIDMNSVDLQGYQDKTGAAFYGVYVTGTFDNWAGKGHQLRDNDGDGVFSGVAHLPTGVYEYQFTINGWDGLEAGAPEQHGPCDHNPDDLHPNYGLVVLNQDNILVPRIEWQGCNEAANPSVDNNVASTPLGSDDGTEDTALIIVIIAVVALFLAVAYLWGTRSKKGGQALGRRSSGADVVNFPDVNSNTSDMEILP